MKREQNKNQHFIPQCYLRSFSKGGKSLNVYSKKYKRKSPIQAISKTACQDYFYRIPEKFISSLNTEIFDPNFFETEFFDANVERLFGPLLKEINQKADAWKIDNHTNEILLKSNKEIFAALIGIQYLRMPNIREKYSGLRKKSTTERLEIIKSFYSNENPLETKFIESIEMQYDDEYKSIDHSNIFSDQEIVNNIQDLILDKVWIFYISNQDDFYTSDNPILIKPHIKHEHFIYDGFGMKGVEIIFPIGSSVLLTLWDKGYFQEKGTQNNKFCMITDESKRQYNCYQYIFANDEVYSKRDDFNLIDSLKSANGGNEIFRESPKILINGK